MLKCVLGRVFVFTLTLVVVFGLALFLFDSSKATKFSLGSINHIRSRRQNSGIECVLPPYPDHGNWKLLNGEARPGDKVPESSVIKFRCHFRYKLSSNNPYLVCDENWNSLQIPECDKLCPPLYSSATFKLKCTNKFGREVKCSEATQGTYLEYNCTSFFETPFGYRKTLLCEDGKWNQKPLCQPVCGRKNSNEISPLVYGAKPNEKLNYPWVAALYKKDNDSYQNVCGGSILSQKVVLTAAHCVTNDYGDKLPKDVYLVGAGKLYNKYQDPGDTYAQYRKLSKIVVPKHYKGDSQRFSGDIAVLVTKDEFILNEVIQPVCFSNVKNIYLHAGKIGEVSGWGLTEGGTPSEVLRTLKIPYKYEATCAAELPSDWADKYYMVDKMCAGFYNKSMGVCPGDSGNGFVFKNSEDNRYYIHGLVSVSPRPAKSGCNAQQNALYTKVAFYYEFIDRLVTKHAPKVKDCILPPYPIKGTWTIDRQKMEPGDSVPSSTTLKIRCNDGFKLSSRASKIKCGSAHNMPTCQLSCSALNFSIPSTTYRCADSEGLTIYCSEAVDGTNLSYECPKGYKIPDGSSNNRTCLHGSWGYPQPQCVKIPKIICPPIHPPPAAIMRCMNKRELIDCNEPTSEMRLEYKCARFYGFPSGYKKILNCKNGTWDFPIPVCSPVCGKKESEPDGLTLGTGTGTYKLINPWVVAIYQSINDSYQYVCGGSILNQRIVLTAAHCVTDLSGKILGKNDFLVGGGNLYNHYHAFEDPEHQFLKLSKILVPEEYKRPGGNGQLLADIAVLVTEGEFFLSEVVRPICFDNKVTKQLHPRDTVEVSWWPRIQGNLSLNKLNTQRILFPGCVLNRNWHGTIDKICIPIDDQILNMCNEDSGHGLVLRSQDNTYYILGISMGSKNVNRCEVSTLTFYTKVEAYSEFISRLLAEYPPETKDCILPGHPENGRWKIAGQMRQPGDAVLSSTILEFKCNVGYKLSSSKTTIECGSTHEIPRCQKPCPSLKFPNGTNYQCTNTEGKIINCLDATDGSKLSFTCPEGYQTVDRTSKMRFCNEGSWGWPQPKCVLFRECGKRISNTSSSAMSGESNDVQYPWYIAIYNEASRYKAICSGSLISQSIIVTSANCVIDDVTHQVRPKEYFLVTAGWHKNTYSYEENVQYSEISKVVVPPEYKEPLMHDLANIALLVAKTAFTYDDFVQPICFYGVHSIQLELGTTVVGWGWIIHNGPISSPPPLDVIRLPYETDDTCQRALQKRERPFDTMCIKIDFRDTKVCTVYTGSGLTVKNPEDGRYYLYGVFGKGYLNELCFTHRFAANVSSYCDFIDDALSKYP